MTLVPIRETETTVKVNGSTKKTNKQSNNTTYDVQANVNNNSETVYAVNYSNTIGVDNSKTYTIVNIPDVGEDFDWYVRFDCEDRTRIRVNGNVESDYSRDSHNASGSVSNGQPFRVQLDTAGTPSNFAPDSYVRVWLRRSVSPGGSVNVSGVNVS